jgi:hypothetical protein
VCKLVFLAPPPLTVLSEHGDQECTNAAEPDLFLLQPTPTDPSVFVNRLYDTSAALSAKQRSTCFAAHRFNRHAAISGPVFILSSKWLQPDALDADMRDY